MKVLTLIPINWSEHHKPNPDCRYDHIVGVCPLGKFLITWKGWKEYDSPTLDETPWGDFEGAYMSVTKAKEEAERLYREKVMSCFEED